MKTPLLLPPAVALAIVATGLVSQRRTLSALEQETVAVNRKIAALAGGGDGAGDTAGKPGREATSDSAGRPDLKALALRLEKAGDIARLRDILQFKAVLATIEAGELLELQQELAGMDLTPDLRNSLEGEILEALGAKDPRAALAAYAGRMDGEMNWRLGKVFENWVKQDAAAAALWFDEAAAAGAFESKSLDGRSATLLRFESEWVSKVYTSDAAAAAARLQGLTERERLEVLSSFSGAVSEENQVAFADLVRGAVPAEQRTRLLSSSMPQASAAGDFGVVEAYFDRIQVTPEERPGLVRAAAVQQVRNAGSGGGLTEAAMDRMRAWVQGQEPAAVDSTTGEALATWADQSNRFAEAASLASRYHQAGGNDALLEEILNRGVSRRHKAAALDLAGQLRDENKRNVMLRRFQ